MILPSINNLLAKLDSTFNKESTDTNFYQILQLIALEIDDARRELERTRTDNYFYNVRDDQLFSNLGVLLKVNKQPFFTKRNILKQLTRLTITEDLRTKPKCLAERLIQLDIEWETELNSTSEVEFTDKSPFIITGAPDPLTGLFDAVNETLLKTALGPNAKQHFVSIPGIKFGTNLFLRLKSTDITGDSLQSEFMQIQLPSTDFIGPIVTTRQPTLYDIVGNTIQVPTVEDPFGFRQYRKILYGVLKSYLTGPSLEGVAAGIQPFFDLPVEIVENYTAIPDLYKTNAINVEDETMVHTFQVNVLLTNTENERNLAELSEQVSGVLEFVKPAHTLPRFQYVIPEHFFCPTDNPFGVKHKSIALEPTVGPCGEKVYINPTTEDLGAEAYYQDVLGYRLYCDFKTNYFGTYCGYSYYGYDVSSTLRGYYDVLDRNYFYIQNGQRTVACPFVRNREVDLLIEHRNGTDPTSVLIEGDVDEGPNTFHDIPYVKNLRVNLTKNNGAKTVRVTFHYPEQAKTNAPNRRLNETLLGTGCHGDVVVEGVTFLINTMPQECCVDEYIDDDALADTVVAYEEQDILRNPDLFYMNDEVSVLNGTRNLGGRHIDEPTGFVFDSAMMTNVHTRVTNDANVVLLGDMIPQTADTIAEYTVCDSFHSTALMTNGYLVPSCDGQPSVLNVNPLMAPEKEFLTNSGSVVVTSFEVTNAFILNGVPQYNRQNADFISPSLLNGTEIKMAPFERYDLEPWNPSLKDKSECPVDKQVECSAC